MGSKLFAAAAAFVVAAWAGTAQAAAPAIYNVVLDATGSVNDADFRKSREAVVKFAELLFARSQARPGARADWLAVSLFGGKDDYEGTVFINCSDREKLVLLARWLLSKEHPKFGSTAVYTAIGKATMEVVNHDRQLPGQYIKNLVGTPADVKANVRRFFPNQYMNLFVIGVGNASGVNAYRGMADHVQQIENFDSLAAALLNISEMVQ
jgi:hypothetical protein